jgi:alkanesulfonate monooxygenase SsuD/methylene tetrahydromethanopterin reductase-like flavin-dependent oxidoreductase (luciferase family)
MLQRQALEVMATKAGRDPAGLEVTLLRPIQILDRPSGASRRPLIGNAEEVAEDIRAYEQAGLSHLVLGFRTTNGAEILQQIDRFAAEVKPLLG